MVPHPTIANPISFFILLAIFAPFPMDFSIEDFERMTRQRRGDACRETPWELESSALLRQ
jgi:hypothetical protein